MSQRAKISSVIFLLALALRLLVLWILLPQLNPEVDRDHYRALARNLAAGNKFVARDDDTGRVLPNVARTPVYPLFLATLMRIGGDRLGLFLFVQCFLGALTCALTVWLASRWVNWRGAALAGLLVAIDPNSVIRCADLLTEILFTVFLVGGACVLAWGATRRFAWLAGGLLWSLAALTRPIAMWLWLVAVVILILQTASWRDRVSCIAGFLIGFAPLPAMWAARNAAVTGQWFVSTIATHNLMLYRAAGIEAVQRGETLEQVQQRIHDTIGDVQFYYNRASFDQRLRLYRETSRQVIAAAPLIWLKQTMTGWVKILLGPGARSLENALRQPQPAARWWPPVYALWLAVVCGFGIYGAIKLGRTALWLVLLIAYFVVLAGGPESNSRFRLPIMPMILTLAVAGAPTFRKNK